MKEQKTIRSGAFAFFLYCSMGASAQLEEVIVTAQKRAESLQDVSVSVTVLGGDKLNEVGIARVEELSAYIPNLTLSETAIGTQLFIRGIGSGVNQGFEQSVGTYVDGVYYGRAQLTRSPFFDMERVEVLRGPQVTLFGNNSIGGALSLSTAKPGDAFEASVSALYEPDNEESEVVLMASGPLNELVSARLAYRKFDFGGYVYNRTLSRDEPDRDFETTRLTFLMEPTEDIRTTLKLEHSTFDVVGRQITIYGGLPNNFGAGSSTSGFSFASGTPSPTANLTLAQIYNNRTFFPGTDNLAPDGNSLLFSPDGSTRYSNGDFSNNTTNNITLNASFVLEGGYEIATTLSYLDYQYDEVCDCDFTGLVLFNYFTAEDYDQQSLELRLTSPGNQAVDFIAGLYVQEDSLDYDDTLEIPGEGAAVANIVAGISSVAGFAPDLANVNVPRSFDQDTSQQALFGQLTWNITESLRLMLGLRRTHYSKEAVRFMDIVNGDGSALNATPGSAQAPGGLSQLESLDFLIGSVFAAYRHTEKGKRERYKTGYNAIVEWDLSDSILLYASLTNGFKAGGYDVRANGPTSAEKQPDNASIAISRPGTFEFEDEEVKATELGAKMRLTDSIELNAAYYYSDIENLQISTFDGSVGFNVTNAGAAVSQGIELEMRAAIADGLLLTASIATLDFEFTDFKNGTCIATDELIVQNGLDLPLQRNCRLEIDGTTRAYFSDLDGQPNVYVADYSGLISLSYQRPVFDRLLLNSSVDYSFTDEYFANENLDPNMKQPAYGKFNVRVSLGDTDETWSVALLGRNITDETTIGFSNNVPLATSQFAAPTYYGFFDPGRTVAAQFKYNF